MFHIWRSSRDGHILVNTVSSLASHGLKYSVLSHVQQCTLFLPQERNDDDSAVDFAKLAGNCSVFFLTWRLLDGNPLEKIYSCLYIVFVLHTCE